MNDATEDFLAWMKVWQELQNVSPKQVKPGAIYWCSLGLNVGSEVYGKGAQFARPVLVLLVCNQRLAYVAPTTTKMRTGYTHPQIVVAGKLEFLLLDQIRIIDTSRIGDFIDEISSEELKRMRLRAGKIFAYYHNKKLDLEQ